MSILLLLVMGSFATGILQTLHMMEHACEDAAADKAAAAASSHDSAPTPLKHHHSEEGCPICAQFHAPIISMTCVPVLVDSGRWVPFVSMLAVSQRSQTFPSRISCRGPPAC